MIDGGPLLRTERLDLWRPRLGDMPGLIELIAAEETRRFLGSTQPDEKGQFERLMRNAGGWTLYGYGSFYVRPRGQDEIVGNCGIFHSWRGFGQGMDDVPEAGWIIRHDHWGRGIAREAMHAILAWFDSVHGPRRTTAMIEETNAVSLKLAEALGFAAYGRQQYEGAQLVLCERTPDQAGVAASASQGLPEWVRPSAR